MKSAPGRAGRIEEPNEYLYWDCGHCRGRYDQAVRMGKWKGIHLGRRAKLQLYDLENDIGGKTGLAGQYPDVVKKIEAIMEEAFRPHPRRVQRCKCVSLEPCQGDEP